MTPSIENNSKTVITPYVIALDSETSGLDPTNDHIMEIAFRILNLSTGNTICSYSSVVMLSEKQWALANPKALAVNGITWQKVVSEGQTFKKISNDIISLFKAHNIHKGNSFFLCQNPSFDRAFFSQVISVDDQNRNQFPFHWLDLASMEVAIRFNSDVKEGRQHQILSLSKDNIAKRYQIEAEKMPHEAMNGVDHLIEIYQKIVGFSKK